MRPLSGLIGVVLGAWGCLPSEATDPPPGAYDAPLPDLGPRDGPAPDAPLADAAVDPPPPDAAPRPPACRDGEDNDGDGLIDFPIDPGCGSADDLDEAERPIDRRPVCVNGLDDDHDGRTDLVDPGCADPLDEDERDPPDPAPCANGVDDDGDGFIDYPDDPGCRGAGDDEADPRDPPACANDADDDGDGRIDYPDDPGCAARSDPDEADPARTPECANGVDDDRDGAIDWPADFGCAAAGDDAERGACDATSAPLGQVVRGDTRRGGFRDAGACGGRSGREAVFVTRFSGRAQALEFRTLEGTVGEHLVYVRRRCDAPITELGCARAAGTATVRIEDPEPGDYYAIVDGVTERGGPVRFRVDAVPLLRCRNGEDDDGDGRVDYPADPGCRAPGDDDETSPDPLPACADGVDNDGDVLIDFPVDVGCNDAADDDEAEPCGQGVPVLELGAEQSVAGAPSSDAFGGVCGGFDLPEWVVRFDNPSTASLTFEVAPPGHAVYLRAECRDVRSEVGCGIGAARFEDLPPGTYFVVIEGAGPSRLSVRVDRRRPGCDDGQDNDLDGLVDLDDPGCVGPADGDERDGGEGACADGADNDADGLRDWPDDPGCGARGDADEADGVAPACANGVDDDGDGAADFPADEGCAAPGDASEAAAVARVECSNGADDDGNGLVDWPLDPGCRGPGDLSETTEPLPACANGRDDDRDGRTDWPRDPGCTSAGDPREAGPVLACANGLDDDGDGKTDFPADPGCQGAGDGSEVDPVIPPRCANRVDDDRDGLRDYPQDPGCASPADDDESGPRDGACNNGWDDDGDGRVDLADPGCVDETDGSEADPPTPPACANGVDDDGDGFVDWPRDGGCEAAGAPCELRGAALCAGGCTDVQADPANCGGCGQRCAGRCVRGRCDGLRAFAGVRTDVPDTDLFAWRPCYREPYDRSDTAISDLAFACDGALLMLGCRPVGARRWTVLAMGDKDQVLRQSGGGAHEHNGVAWYLIEDGSMGFADGAAPIRRRPCDIAPGHQGSRMCWLTRDRRIAGGERCGARTRLAGSDRWERAAWTRD